jgi:NAD(P)-dependent dehydrogenase (short-subunit alcohol dehydrogenase family)
VPHLAQRQGAVVFMGSVHTRRSFPGASPYAATKAATEALSRVLAAELGPKQIRVGCIVPGAVPSEINIRAGLFDEAAHKARMDAIAPLHALGRVGTEEEIAEAVEYLIRAEWTTGASLVVDGGLSLGVSNF